MDSITNKKMRQINLAMAILGIVCIAVFFTLTGLVVFIIKTFFLK